MGYRCETPTIEGFVQQLAVSYVTHGYWFYVTGFVPAGKDPHSVDEKLIAKYGIDISKYQRARRKAAGLGNLHYLRHGRFFLLIATYGPHKFYEDERDTIKDLRETPIKFASYAISFRNGHASVRIERGTCNDLKHYFVDLAVRRSTKNLQAQLAKIPFEPWAPVRGQLVSLVRAINRRRSAAGLEPVPLECLRLKRRILRPFGETKPEEHTRRRLISNCAHRAFRSGDDFPQGTMLMFLSQSERALW